MRITVINSVLHVVVENDNELNYIQNYTDKPVNNTKPKKGNNSTNNLQTCPECSTEYNSVNGLGVHRAKMHGVKSVMYEYNRAAYQRRTDRKREITEKRKTTEWNKGDVTCSGCERKFPTQKSANYHRSKMHGWKSSTFERDKYYRNRKNAKKDAEKDSSTHEQALPDRIEDVALPQLSQ